MKKIIIFIVIALSILITPFTFAAVTFKLNISDPSNSNYYFFCMPNTGCFSILDARKGQTYPVLHHLGIKSIYVLDATNMRVSPQYVPPSCQLSHISNKTIVISGSLVKAEGVVMISGLRCSVE